MLGVAGLLKHLWHALVTAHCTNYRAVQQYCNSCIFMCHASACGVAVPFSRLLAINPGDGILEHCAYACMHAELQPYTGRAGASQLCNAASQLLLLTCNLRILLAAVEGLQRSEGLRGGVRAGSCARSTLCFACILAQRTSNASTCLRRRLSTVTGNACACQVQVSAWSHISE